MKARKCEFSLFASEFSRVALSHLTKVQLPQLRAAPTPTPLAHSITINWMDNKLTPSCPHPQSLPKPEENAGIGEEADCVTVKTTCPSNPSTYSISPTPLTLLFRPSSSGVTSKCSSDSISLPLPLIYAR